MAQALDSSKLLHRQGFREWHVVGVADLGEVKEAALCFERGDALGDVARDADFEPRFFERGSGGEGGEEVWRLEDVDGAFVVFVDGFAEDVADVAGGLVEGLGAVEGRCGAFAWGLGGSWGWFRRGG